MEELQDPNTSDALKKLEQKIGYVFKNKKLLRQALTRESAIQERIPGAAELSYQTLEFVGDAALKHALSRILYAKKQGNTTEAELHSCVEKLVGNENTLPRVANALGLSKFIIKGKGEGEVTTKMKADAVEAILGAISLDDADQTHLFRVIAELWKPCVKELFPKPKAKKKSTAQAHAVVFQGNNNNAPAQDDAPLTPRTSKIFSTLSGLTALEDFEAVVSQASNVNARNTGKTGNTALMTLLSRKKFRADKELPRAQLLIKYGALWLATNREGKSAEDIARTKNIDPAVIIQLKSTPVVKK